MVRAGTYESGKTKMVVTDGPGDCQTITINGDSFSFNVNGYRIDDKGAPPEVAASEPEPEVEADPFAKRRTR